MAKRKNPKIKQNEDVKKKAVIGVRTLKEYLYNKRANLTYEEVNAMINDLAVKIYNFAYETGWNDRNEVHKVRKASTKVKLVKAWNDFYSDRVGEITVDCMENVRYLIDIALRNRDFDIDYTLKRQVYDNNI